MQAPGGLIRRIGALGAVGVVGVDHPEIRRLHSAEMPFGVDQELGPVFVHGEREVIGDGLMHVFALSPAEGGGEVLAGGGVIHLCLPKGTIMAEPRVASDEWEGVCHGRIPVSEMDKAIGLDGNFGC